MQHLTRRLFAEIKNRGKISPKVLLLLTAPNTTNDLQTYGDSDPVTSGFIMYCNSGLTHCSMSLTDMIVG